MSKRGLLVDEALRHFGSVDLLVNNASITRHIPMEDLEEATEEVWDEVFDVNVKAMFFCARAAAVPMKKNSRGAIVNLGSIPGRPDSAPRSRMPYPKQPFTV